MIAGVNHHMDGDTIIDVLATKDLREGILVISTVWNKELKYGQTVIAHQPTDSYFKLGGNRVKIVSKFKSKKLAWKKHKEYTEEVKKDARLDIIFGAPRTAQKVQRENKQPKI